MNAKDRITTWSYGDHSFPINADDHWQRFKAEPFDEQVISVADCFFWQIQLSWIEQPLDDRKRFWDAFSKSDKEAARNIAVYGLLYSNNVKALELINDTISLERDRIAGKLKDQPSERTMERYFIIGLRFAEIAVKKDHRLWRQLANIIEAGGIDGGIKGGEDSFNGQVIREFCQLVSNSRALPTKKNLREALGLSSEKPDSERLRIALNELGLSGLPQGSTPAQK